MAVFAAGEAWKTISPNTSPRRVAGVPKWTVPDHRPERSILTDCWGYHRCAVGDQTTSHRYVPR